MAELKRYLYDGLNYKISTGIQPIIVNGTVIPAKQSVPQVIWNLSFDKVNYDLKNNIESIIFSNKNSTFIKSYIGPHYYIGKRINPVGDVPEFYLTYIFEYEYYSTFVNKPLNYTVDGSDHLIEDTLRIPISQVDGDTPIIFSNARELPRKLLYLSSEVDILHDFYNHFSMKFKFNELAPVLAYTNLFVAGASYADDNSSC